MNAIDRDRGSAVDSCCCKLHGRCPCFHIPPLCSRSSPYGRYRRLSVRWCPLSTRDVCHVTSDRYVVTFDTRGGAHEVIARWAKWCAIARRSPPGHSSAPRSPYEVESCLRSGEHHIRRIRLRCDTLRVRDSASRVRRAPPNQRCPALSHYASNHSRVSDPPAAPTLSDRSLPILVSQDACANPKNVHRGAANRGARLQPPAPRAPLPPPPPLGPHSYVWICFYLQLVAHAAA